MKRNLCICFLIAIHVFTLSNTTDCFAATGRLDPALADSLAELTEDPFAKAEYFSRAWLHKKTLSALGKADSNDAETLWRLARVHIDLGENVEGDEALNLYEMALTEAQKAVDIDPNDPLAWQTLATACGRVALFKGVFKSIGLVKRVHVAALNAVAKGDSMPVALYILGRTHKKLIEKPGFVRSLLGLGFADEDSASYYFERALKVSGGNMVQCRTEYGEFLNQTKNEKTKALIILQTALELPLRDEQDEKSKIRAENLIKMIE